MTDWLLDAVLGLLLLGLAGAAGEHGAAQRVGAGLHHRTRRHKVVAEAVVDQLAAPKARRVNGPRHAPIVGPRALGFVDGAGAGEHTRHARPKVQRAEAAKHIGGAPRLLALQQLVLPCHGQLGQCLAAGDRTRIHPRQNAGERGRCLLGMGDLLRQRRHQGRFALSGAARFQGVIKRAHAWVSL